MEIQEKPALELLLSRDRTVLFYCYEFDFSEVRSLASLQSGFCQINPVTKTGQRLYMVSTGTVGRALTTCNLKLFLKCK